MVFFALMIPLTAMVIELSCYILVANMEDDE